MLPKTATDPPRCFRGLTDEACEDACCRCCDREDRLGEDELCGSCLTERAEMAYARERDDRTPADHHLEAQRAAREDRACGEDRAWAGRDDEERGF